MHTSNVVSRRSLQHIFGQNDFASLLFVKQGFQIYGPELEGYEFMYLDIDNLKSCLVDEFTNYITNISYDNIIRLIDDYIFLTFIIGNDFIISISFSRLIFDLENSSDAVGSSSEVSFLSIILIFA